MIETLQSILTDASARTDTAVEAKLIADTSAGVPWADEA